MQILHRSRDSLRILTPFMFVDRVLLQHPLQTGMHGTRRKRRGMAVGMGEAAERASERLRLTGSHADAMVVNRKQNVGGTGGRGGGWVIY